MGQADDEELMTVRLTRKQWRAIHAAIGDMWSGPQDVLYDKLDGLLAQPSKERQYEPDVFGCDFYR